MAQALLNILAITNKAKNNGAAICHTEDTVAPMKQKRILIADDEAAIVSFVREVLSDEGYEVLTTHNGNDALQILLTQSPDLAILDHAMPELNGGDVLDRLRKQGISTPIVIMSANTSAELFILAGAEDFLAKPFEIPALLEIVKRRLG